MEEYDSLNSLCDNEFENILKTNPLHQSIGISMESTIVSFKEKKTHHIFDIETKDKETKQVFLKYITLVDFLKLLIGKYKNENTNILPCLEKTKNENSKYEKYINEPNNYAYVDSFFYWMSSNLSKSSSFPHGILCYDQFICNKRKCRINIADDLEYLCDSNYFNENINKIFHFEDPHVSNLFLSTQKEKINIDNEVVSLGDIEELEFIETNDVVQEEECVVVHDDESNEKSDKDDDESSEDDDDDDDSNSIHTSDEECNDSEEDEEDEEEDDDEYDEDDEEESDNESSDDEENVMLKIENIPAQVVVLEKCENTFDSLLENDVLVIEELESALFQIIVILYTYQKLFKFTHNDLHTNNIMYVNTEESHLTYQIQGKYYKIPTHGKIYKIIDFGRAIYTYQDKLMCSDSFSNNGTAHTQYNFGPYYDPNKPVIEPNYSFDLCRLACSMFVFICDDIQNIKKYREMTPVYDLIFSWLYDDNGRNMLYRSNGKDKYPGFKLYKMISKIVHNHVPDNQFSHACFEKYILQEKPESIIDIDELVKSSEAK